MVVKWRSSPQGLFIENQLKINSRDTLKKDSSGKRRAAFARCPVQLEIIVANSQLLKRIINHN